MSPTPSQATRPDVPAPEPAGPDAVVVFLVGPWRFGLPIRVIAEALPAARITPLPDAPDGVVGYVDVRGDPLPVFDLRSVFGAPAGPLRPSHHFLVCQADGRGVILWIDRILRLDGDLRPAERDLPASERSPHVEALARSDDVIVLIQDLDPLLRPDQLQAVRRSLRSLLEEGGDGAGGEAA